MSASSPATPPPRLYCILATEVPVALVFRRGPSDWFQLLRWWFDKGVVEPGVWVHKKLFPRRCDLSADGELLLFYLCGGVKGFYRVYCGISKSPWLHPLTSWDEGDTWGRGWCFVAGSTLHTWNEPRYAEIPTRYVTIQRNDNVSFVNERRRGWAEAADCPPRASDDVWDEKRNVILHKGSPVGGCALRLIGGLYKLEHAIDGRAPSFEIQLPSGIRKPLVEAAWADWDQRGRLLIATKQGALRVAELRGDELSTVQEHDLSDMTPNPQPAPAWALLSE